MLRGGARAKFTGLRSQNPRSDASVRPIRIAVFEQHAEPFVRL